MDMPRLHMQVEETCMNAWPALKEIFYDGWLIRLANGQTRRTNSVNVIGKANRALADKIAYCEDVYRAHGQPAYFRILSSAANELDAALAARGYTREDETCTLFMNFRRDHPPDRDRAIAVEVHEGRPPAAWLKAHRLLTRRTPEEARALHAVLDNLAIPAFFGEARDEDGEIASVAFAAIHERMMCLQWVVTDPEQRRRGLSRATLSALLQRGREMGATGACLQVVAANVSAIRLYESLGFGCELYRYHYRVR
ncbi:MAG TPA: GNAT family N-acetyltransferase [Rhizomicrobium sp.]|nr:GNAT family N-acetyltransferase [Rhizomicrobium sp.]